MSLHRHPERPEVPGRITMRALSGDLLARAARAAYALGARTRTSGRALSIAMWAALGVLALAQLGHAALVTVLFPALLAGSVLGAHRKLYPHDERFHKAALVNAVFCVAVVLALIVGGGSE